MQQGKIVAILITYCLDSLAQQQPPQQYQPQAVEEAPLISFD